MNGPTLAWFVGICLAFAIVASGFAVIGEVMLPLVIGARGIKYLRATVEVDADALRAGIRRSI